MPNQKGRERKNKEKGQGEAGVKLGNFARLVQLLMVWQLLLLLLALLLPLPLQPLLLLDLQHSLV